MSNKGTDIKTLENVSNNALKSIFKNQSLLKIS